MGSNKVTPNKYNLVQDTKLSINKKLILGDTGEWIAGDGTDLDIVSSNDMELGVGRDLIVTAVRSAILSVGAGDIYMNDGATEKLHFDLDTTVGEVDINLKTNGDDLVFNQFDGNEVVRFTDEGHVQVTNNVVFAAETANTIGNGATGTIDWGSSQKQKVTITGTGITCNFTNPRGPCNLLLKVVQGDGSDVIATWDGDIKWPGNDTVPTLSTGNGDIDIISFYFDGNNYFGVASLDFA